MGLRHRVVRLLRVIGLLACLIRVTLQVEGTSSAVRIGAAVVGSGDDILRCAIDENDVERRSGRPRYIVSMNMYDSRDSVSLQIGEILTCLSVSRNRSRTDSCDRFCSDWKEVERTTGRERARNYPTDFTLLELSKDSEVRGSQIVALRSAESVKSVWREVRHIPPFSKRHTLNVNDVENPRGRGMGMSARKILEKWGLRGGRGASQTMADVLGASKLWSRNITGRGVRVAVFDTGIKAGHPHIRNLVERSVWTHEDSMNDGVGHGSFVTGVIASHRECTGFAPDALVYAFKVFSDEQVSYTSWFLDAFNYAMFVDGGVHVINLSIGGPDFLDRPFAEKLRELQARGIIIVSAIGNDGPSYGTAMNPADDIGTIGVGGITLDHKMASFSSRGMTTWELDGRGYGRIKPDIVVYAQHLVGSDVHGGCRRLSGTSVASPVIAGAVALLMSILPPGPRRDRSMNPASIKQALIRSAQRLDGPHMFEQGAGLFRLEAAAEVLMKSIEYPRVTLLPESIDFVTGSCSYMWPYCRQPMYSGAMPVIVNVTVTNALGARGYIEDEPRWVPGTNGESLDVTTDYPDVLWPWGGYVSVFLRVRENVEGAGVDADAGASIAEGELEFVVRSTPVSAGRVTSDRRVVRLPVRVTVLSKPPARHRRLLWDQFHSLQYPPGHIPRDDLEEEGDVLDWRADHLHTNFRSLFNTLVSAGFFVEVLVGDWTCFDASRYGALLLVDSEDIHSPSEREKLQCDVKERGLGLIVVADWFNTAVMESTAFYDDNTRRWWPLSSAGANVPALNCLLEPFGIAFGDRIYSGTVRVGRFEATFASGNSIVRFPRGGRLLLVDGLRDETETRIRQQQSIDSSATSLLDRIRHHTMDAGEKSIAVLGLLRGSSIFDSGAGNIAVFGDSQCMDESTPRGSAREIKACHWLVRVLARFATRTPEDSLLDYAFASGDMEAQGSLANELTPHLDQDFLVPNTDLPRMRDEQMERLLDVSSVARWSPLAFNDAQECPTIRLEGRCGGENPHLLIERHASCRF